MQKYHKISAVFKRDMEGTKKLMEGVFNDPTVRFLAESGVPWEFTEKIDGTNIRVHWDGHAVKFGGRTDRAQIPKPLLEKLNAMFGTPEAEELFEQKFGETDIVLFGEGYGPGIQNGGAYRQDVSFILFDAQVGDNFLTRDSVHDIAQCFGIDVVPSVFTGTIEEAVAFVKTAPDSHIGTAKMEGLVGRPVVELRDRLGQRVIVKIKVRDFKEG